MNPYHNLAVYRHPQDPQQSAPGEQPQTIGTGEISELLNIRPDSVKRTTKRLAGRGLITLPPLVETSFKGADGRIQYGSEYRVGKRDSFVIVAQLSPEFTARLVDRWQQLEARAAQPAVNLADPAFLRRALLEYTEQVIELQQTIAEQAPKVEALDRLTFADGAICITEAAKTLQLQPKALFDWLSANQWIYRRPACATWTAYQDKLQRGVLKHKITTVNRSDGSEKVTWRVLVPAKGLAELARYAAAGGMAHAGGDR